MSAHERNILITEEQFERLFELNELENKYYSERQKNGSKSLTDLWKAIDKKQKMLFKKIFNGIDQLTQEKANVFGVDKLVIPRNIAMAGNKKIPENVLLINITSALGCPSYFLGTCQIVNGNCYAMSMENRWPSTRNRGFQTDLMNTELLRRYENGDKGPMKQYFSLVEMYINVANATAEEFKRRQIANWENEYGEMPSGNDLRTIYKIADSMRIKHIRLNERGDFPCQLSVDLWTEFANKIAKKYDITVHAYTARNLDFSKTGDNMSVMPSHGGINIGDEEPRTFYAVTDELYDSKQGGNKIGKDHQPILGVDKKGNYFYKCPCTSHDSKCGLCKVCFQKNMTGKPYIIYVRLHGAKNAEGLRNLPTPQEMKNVMDTQANMGWSTPEENNMRVKQAKVLDKYGKKSKALRKKPAVLKKDKNGEEYEEEP